MDTLATSRTFQTNPANAGGYAWSLNAYDMETIPSLRRAMVGLDKRYSKQSSNQEVAKSSFSSIAV